MLKFLPCHTISHPASPNTDCYIDSHFFHASQNCIEKQICIHIQSQKHSELLTLVTWWRLEAVYCLEKENLKIKLQQFCTFFFNKMWLNMNKKTPPKFFSVNQYKMSWFCVEVTSLNMLMNTKRSDSYSFRKQDYSKLAWAIQ